ELETVANAELRYSDAIFVCNSAEVGGVQQRAVSHGRVGLNQNAFGSGILDQVEWRGAHVSQDLVDHRFDTSVVEQVVQVGPFEVRNPDGAELTCGMRLFERPPGCEITLEEMLAISKFGPRLRAVDQHQVDLVESQRLQRSVDEAFRFGVTLALSRELGCDEELVARDGAGAQGFCGAAVML